MEITAKTAATLTIVAELAARGDTAKASKMAKEQLKGRWLRVGLHITGERLLPANTQLAKIANSYLNWAKQKK